MPSPRAKKLKPANASNKDLFGRATGRSLMASSSIFTRPLRIALADCQRLSAIHHVRGSQLCDNNGRERLR
jgi:hypothetical protein